MLLTIFVKLITLYWTTKSMRSMKAMAALAPQLKALQTKYGDDKQRQQTETMALYKEHGVNPVAGCLPILLQMPIWIALYRMLANDHFVATSWPRPMHGSDAGERPSTAT